MFLVYLLIAIVLVAYFYIKYSFGYWQRRGIVFASPTFPFGNFSKIFQLKLSYGEVAIELYNLSTKPFVGIFALWRPILMIRDSDLMRRILIKDFSYFPNHGTYFDEKNDPLSATLFAIEDQKWKTLRTKMSPTFTSGKMKAIFQTIVECSKNMQSHLDQLANDHKVCEIRELTASNATNIIASVAFGLDVDCIKEPNHDFRKYGRKAFAPNFKNGIRAALNVLNPKLLKWSRMGITDGDIKTYFLNIVKENIKYREENNVVRKDFFQLLIQMKNGIDVSVDDRWTSLKISDGVPKLSINEVAAQAFVFFFASFETSSSTVALCMYEINRNPEIQRRIHKEIDEVLSRHNGEYTYESVGEMKYLDMCIDETLRLYPVVPILFRIASHDYTIPDTEVVIEKGTQVLLPIIAAQRDSKHYQNPNEFIPERFSDESKASPEFSKRPYFPFGEGPRVCIGMRLGKMMTKLALAVMLEKYSYEFSDDQKKRKLVIAPETFIMTMTPGIELKIRKRK